MNSSEGVIHLIKCAVNGLLPDKNLISALNLNTLYKESQKHMVTAIVGMALKDVGVETKEFKYSRGLEKGHRKMKTEMKILTKLGQE